MNDYVSTVLDAATNPDLAGDEVSEVRDRLAQAGVLVEVRPHGERPDPELAAQARRKAGQETPLGELLDRDRE